MGVPNEPIDLAALYRNRFDPAELAFKAAMWQVLGRDYFQRFIRPTDTVLDLGAGSCEFLSAIECASKIAVDLAPPPLGLSDDVRYYRASASKMDGIQAGSVDVVFASNFFEHVADKPELIACLKECHRVLHAGGSLLVLQPNIRYIPGRYWDFLDHLTPLTHVSMAEALRLTGFAPQLVVPRFLPYTVKDARVPRRPSLLRAYLRLRFLWPILGRQMFIHARAS